MKPNNRIAPIDELFTGATDPDISIAEWFHENTKLFAGSEPNLIETPEYEVLKNDISDREEMVAAHGKKYSTATTLPLQKTDTLQDKSFAELLQSRCSATAFDANSTLSLANISTLLNVGYGLNTERGENEGVHRYVPSGGALFPLEIYLLPLRVEEIDAGTLCHYQPRTHELEIIGSYNGQKTAESLLTQKEMTDAAAILFISGNMPRVTWKYGERGYRYILLEAGHVAQNICLAGAALDLGVCPVAGYYDDAVHDLFWMDGVSEFVVYVLCVGRK